MKAVLRCLIGVVAALVDTLTPLSDRLIGVGVQGVMTVVGQKEHVAKLLALLELSDEK